MSWSWLNDEDEYVEYPKEIQKRVESAYQTYLHESDAKQSAAKLSAKKSKKSAKKSAAAYQVDVSDFHFIDFELMLQIRHDDESKQRAVRRVAPKPNAASTNATTSVASAPSSTINVESTLPIHHGTYGLLMNAVDPGVGERAADAKQAFSDCTIHVLGDQAACGALVSLLLDVESRGASIAAFLGVNVTHVLSVDNVKTHVGPASLLREQLALPLLHAMWLQDSLERNEPLPPNDYVLVGTSAKKRADGSKVPLAQRRRAKKVADKVAEFDSVVASAPPFTGEAQSTLKVSSTVKSSSTMKATATTTATVDQTVTETSTKTTSMSTSTKSATLTSTTVTTTTTTSSGSALAEAPKSAAQWFWEGDEDGDWVAYAADVSERIERASASGDAQCKVDGERYVDLNELLQCRFDDPSRQRSVKREPPLSAPPPSLASSTSASAPTAPCSAAAWSWEDDNGWKPYAPAVSALIEQAYASKAKRVKVDALRFIDFATLMQRRYDDEARERAVRRDVEADGGAVKTKKKAKGAKKATALAKLGEVKGALESALPVEVQELIAMICDVGAMRRALVDMDIDVKQMPLGKLSKKQVSRGYQMLREIETVLNEGASSKAAKVKLMDLSNRFYTHIPHSFGKKRPPVIDSVPLLKEKLTLMDTLIELDAGAHVLEVDASAKSGPIEHPIDSQYKQLNCVMVPVQANSHEWQLIDRAVQLTHAPTHTDYTLSIESILRVDRGNEAKLFAPYSNLQRRLLWHGSRTTNFAGIIGQGLRIAPPEAPVTGYMFGKGVYFANSSSKSANYCSTSKANPYGVLILCDVALGKMLRCLQANEHLSVPLPDACDSTFGVGCNTPDASGDVALGGDTPSGSASLLSTGKLVPSGERHGYGDGDSALLYDEYIVYRTEQVCMRYLIRLHFNYK